MNTNRIGTVAPVALAGILTLFVLTAYSTHQTFAQAKPTTLTLNALIIRQSVDAHPGNVSLGGRLSSEDSGVGGATITVTGPFQGKTDGSSTDVITSRWGGPADTGIYHLPRWVSLGPGTYTFEAHYAGDSDHQSSSATTVVKMK